MQAARTRYVWEPQAPHTPGDEWGPEVSRGSFLQDQLRKR